MGKQKNARKGKSLATGRPPLAQSKTASLSSKATRTIIRKHHALLKEREKAVKTGQTESAAAITQRIQENGGLEKYQQASQTGQLSARGGDTSRVLVSWLKELCIVEVASSSVAPKIIRVLEVGCLSPDNAIAACSNVQMERIDLKSTHALIKEQDFMQRPVPSSCEEKFDLVSLSLVVNFVADASDRGEMLRRTTKFLRTDGVLSESLPALFLTLPLPCVNNSRYMNVAILTRMMASTGYALRNSKSTAKIFYSLWHFAPNSGSKEVFKKTEILGGPSRNNFYIAT